MRLQTLICFKSPYGIISWNYNHRPSHLVEDASSEVLESMEDAPNIHDEEC